MGPSWLDTPLTGGEAITFGLLSAAVVALWLPGGRREAGAEQARRRVAGLLTRPWLVLLAAAALSAAWFGYLDRRGLAALVALAALSWAAHQRGLPAAARLGTGLGLLLLAAGMTAHVVPGFANPRLISSEVLTPGAVPYTRYLNFDKTAVGVLLLAFGGSRIGAWREWRRMLRAVAPVALATFAAVLPLALLLGHVRFEPALRPHLLVWAWTNLLFTCTAEEALFRGFIQRRLERGLAGHRLGQAASLAIASALFGLAHLAGGWTYVLLSTVAGLGYGLAMRRSGRVEGAIAVHFLVNALHFCLFTYPARALL